MNCAERVPAQVFLVGLITCPSWRPYMPLVIHCQELQSRRHSHPLRGQLPDCSRKSLSLVDMFKLSALLSMLCWTAGAVAVAPYNVVLVIFDDLRPVLGAYGDALARTPHLDAFAQGSTIFTRAYSQVSPSLSSKSLLNLLPHISKRCAHPAAIPC